jgi:hypothetical protein
MSRPELEQPTDYKSKKLPPEPTKHPVECHGYNRRMLYNLYLHIFVLKTGAACSTETSAQNTVIQRKIRD